MRLIAVAMLLLACSPLLGVEPREGVEFFETKIRPVLAEKCYKCHSATSEKLKGNLKLDTRESLLKGGENGPAISGSDPDKSLLIKALRYKDEDLQMPPKEKLAEQVVHDFEQWVRIGAPYPAGAIALPKAEDPRNHWAFQKPTTQPLPAVKNSAWIRNPIDNFILAALEKNNLSPAALADKRTLLRRATFDLTGLPPTQLDLSAFLADNSPGAFEKVVDRLLASPQYGERYARHWLDLARYADTKGYVFEEERRYPYSYTYRDWVINALNSDLPYDMFLKLQIAADQLCTKESGLSTQNLAAMGFLTLGRRFLNNQADIIDDRMDVLIRGTQALTVGCARCHDHKFDPISQKDYYSLYGVFASSTEPSDLPLLAQPVNSPEAAAYEKEVAAAEGAVTAFLDKRHAELVAGLRSEKEIAEYLAAAAELRTGSREQIHSLCAKRSLRDSAMNRWINYLKKGADAKDPVFAPCRALTAIPENELPAKSPAIIVELEKDPVGNNILVLAPLKASPIQSMQDLAARYARLLLAHDQPDPICQMQQEQIRAVIRGEDSPTNIARADVEFLFLRDDQAKARELRKKVAGLSATHPGAPPRAMVLKDLPTPVQQVVFKRGNPGMPGDAVQRQFLEVLSQKDRKPFANGSGRLDLANAIASAENPLTARVIVNRVWLEHFGQGLVRTPSDFGTRGDKPTHPELLDYLALRFVNDGWSLKKLHKLILLSSTYQQSALSTADSLLRTDPDNRLLSHQNRRRLDFEATRDSLLFAAGLLDTMMFGRAIDIADANARRRTIYSFIDRQNLPGMFRSFDFASPDAHSPQRFVTTVPQQALFMMNSPFAIQQAKSLIARPEVAAATEPAARVTLLYQMLYQRNPTPDEIGLAVAFVTQEQSPSPSAIVPTVPAVPLWQYGYGSIDEKTGKVTFTSLPFNKGSYQGVKLPDAKLGWCLLTAQGGHPGNDAAHAVIRRFTAPRDCTLSIAGELSCAAEAGDGVRARVVSSAGGILAMQTAHHSAVPIAITQIAVKQGTTLDFIVDCRENVNSDSFNWPITIHIHGPADSNQRKEYASATDFAPPPGSPAPPASPLSAWEKCASAAARQ